MLNRVETPLTPEDRAFLHSIRVAPFRPVSRREKSDRRMSLEVALALWLFLVGLGLLVAEGFVR